ncbi:MAG: hypothetical protein AAGC57_03475 [Pseudomonadota bacterium]
MSRSRLLPLILLTAACAQEPAQPDLAAIYSGVSESVDDSVRRPLITVPGTLGSRLRDRETGTVIWGGGSRGLSADPEDPTEATLIALPILTEDEPFFAHRDGIVPDGILDVATPEVLGIPLDIEVYGGVLRTLSAGGFRSTNRASLLGRVNDATGIGSAPSVDDYRLIAEGRANSFRFDYDWRRDIPTLAREFHAFVELRKRQVAAVRSIYERRAVAPEEITFDLLAHSMGGLVTRYYLMHGPAALPEDGSLPPVTWEGARSFSRVVIVAAPNGGSIIAMDNLINGKSLGPLQPFYPAPLLATHASVWQLFPRARHGRLVEVGGARLDPLDPSLWERFNWGLLAPEADPLLSWLLPDLGDAFERRKRAGAHQARLLRRAKQFHRAIDRWAPKPPGLEMFLVVGGGFATPANAEVDPVSGAFRLTDREEGDGVVLRTSVLLDERVGAENQAGLMTPLRFDTTLFLPDEHVELTKNPVFGDNLLFWLLEQPRRAGELAEPRRTVLGSTAAQPGPEEAPRKGFRAEDR